MFATQVFVALLALATPWVVRADVMPSEPGPGDTFNAGTTCHTTWKGDTNSSTMWQNMAIELMSGSNLGMVHITTVTTGQDGTQDGKFEFPCPEVTPFSAIYFFQFSSPESPDRTWTTRFTIASASGQSTPPANPTQPTSNDPIPWGIGALADPSKAVPAPSFAANPDGGNATTPAAPPATVPTVSNTLSSTSSSASVTPRTSSSSSSSASAAAISSTGKPAVASAASPLGMDARAWMSAAVLGFTALML